MQWLSEKMDLFEVSKEVVARLRRIFCRDAKGQTSNPWQFGEVPARS